MSIPASHFVNIIPRVLSPGSSGFKTNGLLLTKSALLPANQQAVSFSSADSVAEFFGDESDEYLFAQQYFLGVTNQQAAIDTLVIGRFIDADAPGWLRGGKVTAELDAFKAVTNGSLTLRIAGENKAVTSIDLSAATSLSDVAEKVAAAVTGVTGEYSSQLEAFVFTGTEAGKGKDVSYVVPTVTTTSKVGKARAGQDAVSSTDLGELLALRVEDGSVASPGADKQTPAAAMKAIFAAQSNWAGFTTSWEVSLEEAQGFAKFAEDDSGFCFVVWSTDKNLENVLTQQSTVPYQLYNAKAYNCTATIYGNYLYAAGFLAVGASIDWNRTQGMKVWFARNLPGLSPNVSDLDVANALEGIRCNYYGDIKARATNYQWLNRGTVISDHYGFMDVLYGSIWLRNAVQTAIMDGFGNTNRDPYNDEGATLVRGWVQDPITRGLHNGCIDKGLTLSQSQKVQLMQEVGSDISTNLYTDGYYFYIDVTDASVRPDRQSPEVGLVYTYAGSIQKISMPITQVI